MKVTFVSNYLNHHQIPFCNEMYYLLNNNYHFISTTPISNERIKLGYKVNNDYSYEIKSYESPSLLKIAKDIIDESDVVIIGSAPDSLILKRLRAGKLTFKYSERLYKKGLTIKNLPKAFISSYFHHGRFQKYPLYMLCASAYTSRDLSIFKNYKGRMFKWGYFIELKEYNYDKLQLLKVNDITQILWVGRLIECKHAEDALEVAYKLKELNYNFKLNIIGTGILENELKSLADYYNLNKYISFLGSISPENVRNYMEKANIFLFTSDFQEGWGAVLNEAMNSGCAVVASHAIGSVPYLLKHKFNGLIYEFGNKNDFFSKVKFLIDNPDIQLSLGKEAYYTIYNIWNAKVAALRFMNISKQILEGNELKLYDDGPCSQAEIIKNNWFKETL